MSFSRLQSEFAMPFSKGCCLWVFTICLLIAYPSPVMAAKIRLKTEVTGLNKELLSNVEAHLGMFAAAITSGKKGKPELTEKSIRRLHNAAPKEIRAALQPFGYYSPKVTAVLDHEENLWRAEYAVDAGPETLLRSVEVALDGEGKEQIELVDLIKEAALASGQRLNHSSYENLKDALRRDAYSLGYLDGKYTQNRIEIFSAKQLADLSLVFDTGPRYYFGEISIEQGVLSQAFIDKFVSINPGDVFAPRRLTQLQLALIDSPYFNQAEVSIQRDKTENQKVPVSITARPSRSQRYETSLGFGTDTGPRGGAGVLWRRINQHGHQFRTDLRLSAVQSTLASQYKIPVGDVGSEYLDFTADAQRRNINDVDATSYAIGGSLNENRWGGRTRSFLALRRDVWAFGDEPTESSNLLIPGVEYSRIIADDLLFTRRGYSLDVSLEGASDQLLSNSSFLQARVSGRYIAPLGDRGRLLLRGDYGATAADDFDALPPSQRFFNGGAQAVRGYGFEELSPLDAQGNRVGGRYLGTVSLEADYLAFGNFGLALFVDAGNASNDASIDWKTGAGVGLRYKTPVGMFRLDLAHPFDDPDSSFAFHISFGPDLQ